MTRAVLPATLFTLGALTTALSLGWRPTLDLRPARLAWTYDSCYQSQGWAVYLPDSLGAPFQCAHWPK